VPSFVINEADSPTPGRIINTGAETAGLKAAMEAYLATRIQPASNGASNALAQFHTVVIDDFSDRNDLNEVGGRWGTFDAGDQGMITHRFVEISAGNIALEVHGGFPTGEGGATWGGVYTDITPNRAEPRNLMGFRWLAFICQSREAGVYQVHLENGPGQRSNVQIFRVGSAPARIALPIPEFGPVAGGATTIVWSKVDPKPGQQFSLVLDDVLVVK
jgi:hypothetical protein